MGVAALTRGFFSFPPQDPTDGQKKELLKGVEAYEDDKGHQQYRITKVEVRRATRPVAPSLPIAQLRAETRAVPR